ncbi:MAG TPA: DNA repair protein RadC [Candidatus Paceibacterota bacterium]|nr:DNA repair protein RadC [Candidatus Paceibacterota bacterium]
MKSTALYKVEDNDLFLIDGNLQDRKYILKIKEMPDEGKPREKLLKYGPGALSLQELVAVVLGTGTVKEDVLEMSGRVLKEYGERSLASHIDPKVMAKDLDIPLIKAVTIAATAELGRRFFEKNNMAPAVIRTARDVHQYVRDMHNLSKEHLRGIYLNTHQKVIHDEVISIGTLNSNIIHPREVFKPAIEFGAAAIILVHNHPSGSVKPSKADIEITKQLINAGKLIGISLVDHVIVSGEKFASIEASY